MSDLFDYVPPAAPGRYPVSPGFKDGDTSRKAATSVKDRASLLRDRCFGRVRLAGAAGLTADECADQVGESILSIRPRFTELKALGRIADSGQRRRNESGRNAKVWVVAA
jgi:hypothetical protein